jgi:hypothetical protein
MTTAPVDLDAVRSAVDAVPPQQATLTDGQPPVILLAGLPARPFAYFDFRLMQQLQDAGDIDENDLMMIVAYSMAQTTDQQIAALYQLRKDHEALTDAMVMWSANIPIAQLGEIAKVVEASITEYVDVAGVEGTPDGEPIGGLETSAEGNLKPSPPESPSSDAPSLDTPD